MISRTRASSTFECRAIEPALGDDHVGVTFRGLDEALVCRAYRAEVLLHDELGGTASFGDVAPQPSDQADVGGGVDEDLQVEALAEGSVPEHQDPVDDDDARRLDHPDPIAAVVLGVVVDRYGDRCAVGERCEVIVEQRPVEGVGVVVVDGAALLDRCVAEVEVVRVELDR